jgi:hypothetical protein
MKMSLKNNLETKCVQRKKNKRSMEQEEGDKVQMIMRQTNYTEDQAKKLLEENNNDPLVVIRKYMGTYKDPVTPENTAIKSKELNQEMYKQFRQKLHITKPTNMGPI